MTEHSFRRFYVQMQAQQLCISTEAWLCYSCCKFCFLEFIYLYGITGNKTCNKHKVNGLRSLSPRNYIVLAVKEFSGLEKGNIHFEYFIPFFATLSLMADPSSKHFQVIMSSPQFSPLLSQSSQKHTCLSVFIFTPRCFLLFNCFKISIYIISQINYIIIIKL